MIAQIKNFSIKIILTLFLVFSFQKANSCGCFEYYDEFNGYQLFYKSFGVNNNFLLNFISDSYSRYDYQNTEDYYLSKYGNNLKSWQEQTNNAYSIDILYDIIYNKNIYDYLDNNKMSGNLSSFQKNFPELFEYMKVAKKTEFLLNNPEPWSEIGYDTVALEKTYYECLSKNNTSNTEFLKTRYAYQALVISFYLGEYENTLNTYNALIKGKDVLLENWAKIYIGQYYQQKGMLNQAVKNYLAVFKNSIAKREAALYFLKTLSIPSDSLYDLTDDEKYYYKVYRIFNDYNYYSFDLYNQNYSNLLYILKNNIDNEISMIFLNRTISGITSNNLMQIRDNLDNYKPSADLYSNPAQFISELEKIKDQFPDKAYINLSLALLQFVNGNYSKADLYNQTAKQYLNTQEYEYQYKINDFLIKLYSQKQYNPQLTKELNNYIKWFNENKAPTEKMEEIKAYIYLYIANYYKMNNDLSRTAMIYYRSDAKHYIDIYGTINDALNLIKICENPQSYIEEKYTTKAYVNDLNDLIGTIYLRKNDFNNAIKYFSMTDKYSRFAVWVNYDNPFHFYSDKRDTTADSVFIDKLEFTKQLQSKINSLPNLKGDKLAEQERQIGIAYFNTTHMGKTWGYMSYGWTYYGEGRFACSFYGTDFNETINDNYFTANTALNYLGNALAHAKSNDLKAQIQYDIYTIKVCKAKTKFDGYWFEEDRMNDSIRKYVGLSYEDMYKNIKIYSSDVAKFYQKTCPDLNVN